VYESAVRLARRALEHLGSSQEAIDRAEATYRGYDNKRLKAQIEGGDIYAAQDMTREQQRALREELPQRPD
jgi:hypothetical protein